jgi:methionyl-tRNA synthetase
VSGSDEHGTPITITAEQQGVKPQDIVDKYHKINKQALLNLGCAWEPNIDPRGIEYGGALFNRTSDPRHKRYVQENFLALHNAGMFEKKTMHQYYEIRKDGAGRFLPIDILKEHVQIVNMILPVETNVMNVGQHMKHQN